MVVQEAANGADTAPTEVAPATKVAPLSVLCSNAVAPVVLVAMTAVQELVSWHDALRTLTTTGVVGREAAAHVDPPSCVTVINGVPLAVVPMAKQSLVVAQLSLCTGPVDAGSVPSVVQVVPASVESVAQT